MSGPTTCVHFDESVYYKYSLMKIFTRVRRPSYKSSRNKMTKFFYKCGWLVVESLEFFPHRRSELWLPCLIYGFWMTYFLLCLEIEKK